MFAVIVYFWRSWRASYFESAQQFRTKALQICVATAATGVVGLALLHIIKHVFASGAPDFEIEHLFGNAKLMAAALAAAGVLIIVSSRMAGHRGTDVSFKSATWIGVVQGLCLPFRGFSRSGATISTGLALGVTRRRAEEFSFALAVVLTPAVIAKEALRLYKAETAGGALDPHALAQLAAPGLFGMVLSFGAGLLALRWLSSWLEEGRWHFFGAYCLLASLVVLMVG